MKVCCLIVNLYACYDVGVSVLGHGVAVGWSYRLSTVVGVYGGGYFEVLIWRVEGGSAPDLELVGPATPVGSCVGVVRGVIGGGVRVVGWRLFFYLVRRAVGMM